jgi:aspartyl-tRNA(Asn)/glutamyl-tRNA(Gln) amidotransferase subunit C
MAISDTDVRHLAKLANLSLDEAALTRMRGQLAAIVGYVEQLSEVDTNGVEPIANVSGLVNVTRADAAGVMLTSPQVLGNAPQKNEVAILVPKVVER